MANLTVKEKDDKGQPGLVCGKAGGGPKGIGGAADCSNMGAWTVCALLDLECIEYEEGGICLDPKDTFCGLGAIFDMTVMGSKDPYGCQIDGCPPISLYLNTCDPCKPILAICEGGEEVPTGWTLPGGCIWVMVRGSR